VQVCTVAGKLEGAEFDHFFARSKNGPIETWLVCSACNRMLEDPEFKPPHQIVESTPTPRPEPYKRRQPQQTISQAQLESYYPCQRIVLRN
jgi:hypothetical protein